MNSQIKYLISFAIVIIFAIGSFAIMKNVHEKNNVKLKSSFESKKEQLFNRLEGMGKEYGMQVFVKREASEEEIEELMNKISKIDGVSSVTLKSKEEELEKLKEKLNNKDDLIEIYKNNENIFPDSLIVSIDDFNKADKIKDIISEFENVDKIDTKYRTIQNIKENIDSFTEEDIDVFIKEANDILGIE